MTKLRAFLEIMPNFASSCLNNSSWSKRLINFKALYSSALQNFNIFSMIYQKFTSRDTTVEMWCVKFCLNVPVRFLKQQTTHLAKRCFWKQRFSSLWAVSGICRRLRKPRWQRMTSLWRYWPICSKNRIKRANVLSFKCRTRFVALQHNFLWSDRVFMWTDRNLLWEKLTQLLKHHQYLNKYNTNKWQNYVVLSFTFYITKQH